MADTNTKFYATNMSMSEADRAREMLNSKKERELKKLQVMQLEARIKKLQLEEDKAKKRI